MGARYFFIGEIYEKIKTKIFIGKYVNILECLI